MASAEPSPLRFALAGMVAMAVAMGIGRFAYTPILPGMMDGLGLSASDVGLIASANYLGYLIGAFAAAGGWAEGHERTVMLWGLAASAGLAALMGLTESQALFLVIRFFAGIASAFVMVFSSTIVFSRLAAAGRNALQALHFGGVAAGIAVSSLMIGALVFNGADWTAGWLWAGALSAAGFFAVFILANEGPAAAGPVRREPPLPASPALTRIILAYGIFGFGYIVTATFLVAIVRQGEGGRLFESVVWLATGLAGIPSVYFWNLLAKRWGLSTIFTVACFVEALGVAASVGLGGLAGPLLGGMLLGGTFIAITALGLQIGRGLAPLAPRRSLALMTVSFGIGQILGPLAAGIVADWTGNFVVASLGAAVALVVSGLLATASSRHATA